MSRSTWACELKFPFCLIVFYPDRHAPRERVSWNSARYTNFIRSFVTLHVSVWVEISMLLFPRLVMSSRSTWACELKFYHSSRHFHARTSRSTWACELKCSAAEQIVEQCCHAPRERVSWNLNKWEILLRTACHAPRERVSWNHKQIVQDKVSRSRSTWACELKLHDKAIYILNNQSRSTWACELKFV